MIQMLLLIQLIWKQLKDTKIAQFRTKPCKVMPIGGFLLLDRSFMHKRKASQWYKLNDRTIRKREYCPFTLLLFHSLFIHHKALIFYCFASCLELREMEKENQENSDMEVVLLMHKKIEIQNRLFCIEFKETSLVQFMQISHNDSSILLPSHGISSFMDVINCLCSGFGKQKQQQNRGFSKKKELKIDDKVFYFEIGQGNKERGDYYLKISEASASRNNASIIVPSGNSSNNGWELFKKTIAEINKTSSHLFPPLQSHGNCDPAEFSADAKAEPVASVNDQNSSVSRTNVKPSKNKKSSTGKSKMIRAGFKTFYSDPGSNKKSSTVESKMIRTGFKTFYFEPGSNKFGDFIKISSVTGASRTSISVPRSSMQQFHEMVGHFLNSIDDDESQN